MNPARIVHLNTLLAVELCGTLQLEELFKIENCLFHIHVMQLLTLQSFWK
jgi:hypothetical protein